MPQFINITDSQILTPPQSELTADHPYVLCLTTAGANRYLFEFQNSNVLRRWSAAFRISMYERAMLQECYTAALIARSRSVVGVKALFNAYHGALGSKGKYGGWVRVRFSWSIKWQKCWCVVSDTPSSWTAGGGMNHAIHERILYKLSNKQSLRGEARFYESRRDPKNKPIAILGNVYAAYAVYPEKPFLVDSSTLIKVEGSLQPGKGIYTGMARPGEEYKDAFVLLMPEDIPSSSSSTGSSPSSSPTIGSSSPSSFQPMLPHSATRSRFSTSSSFFSSLHLSAKASSTANFESMVTWLVAFYDAFNLYGRPDKLITESSKPESMIFAMPSSLEDSYLDVEEVFLTLSPNGNLETAAHSAREWRSKMKELTLEQLKSGKRVFNPAVLLRNAVAEVPVIREPVPPHLRNESQQGQGGLGIPLRSENASAVAFARQTESITPPPSYPAATAQPGLSAQQAVQAGMRQSRLGGFLRRKSSRMNGDDRHSRSFSESGVENTRVAMNRFSLNEDSEDENAPDLFNPQPQQAARPAFQSSPLRNSTALGEEQVFDTAEEENEMERRGRPSLMHRLSSHRRVQSETRMGELFREAGKGYYSDEENGDAKPPARRVSSDDMLKGQPGKGVGGEATVSSDSLETGTQFNHTFDGIDRRARVRLSESSSDRSETPADPMTDTPRLEESQSQSSPASSMESLPPPKSSPKRARRSLDERAFLGAAASTHVTGQLQSTSDIKSPETFNAPIFQGPVTQGGQPANTRPQNLPPPNRPPPPPGQWNGLPPQRRPEDMMQYNQNLMPPPRDYRPPPPPPQNFHHPLTPRGPQPPYPPDPRYQQPYPQQSHRQSIQDLPMRARGPLPPDRYSPRYSMDSDPRYSSSEDSIYTRRSIDSGSHKVPRRLLPQSSASSNRSRSNPTPPPVTPARPGLVSEPRVAQ